MKKFLWNKSIIYFFILVVNKNAHNERISYKETIVIAYPSSFYYFLYSVSNKKHRHLVKNGVIVAKLHTV